MVRLVRSALRRALRGNHAFGAAVLLEAIGTLTPSPLIEISVDVDMEDSDV
ncbi:MAG: hypothetical protein U0359_39935 [Byssovorax sp.]